MRLLGFENASRARTALLATCALWYGATTMAADVSQAHAPVVVSAMQGDVQATSNGAPVTLRVGSQVNLPVQVRVGAASSLELHQGSTVISAAANSQLDIPKAIHDEETIERVIQSKGNVFYSVAKRPVRKLRVETPYLV